MVKDVARSPSRVIASMATLRIQLHLVEMKRFERMSLATTSIFALIEVRSAALTGSFVLLHWSSRFKIWMPSALLPVSCW